MPITDDPAPTLPPLPSAPGAHLCVLASGSSGNCSVLALRRGDITRCILIDLGLSPRRTFRMLAAAGIGPHQIDGALVTHLDHDHLSAGWRTHMPAHARIWLHERHARHAGTRDGDRWRVAEFEGDFHADECVRVRPLMMAHDDLGVAAFRLDFSGDLGECSLGFATDLGHIHAGLAGHFGGNGRTCPCEDAAPSRPGAVPSNAPVDVLAIESNYCPALQHASARPDALKHRIMCGRGHLSNQEAVSAILQIEPREHVVLLHLSRECNSPEIVAALHAGADYALTITSQTRPSRWIRIGSTERSKQAAPLTSSMRHSAVVVRQQTLWSVGA